MRPITSFGSGFLIFSLALPFAAASASHVPGYPLTVTAVTCDGSCRWSVLQIDPTTGTRSVISGLDPGTGLVVGSGPEFERPRDIAVASADVAFVTDPELISPGPLEDVYHDRLFRVDLATGDRMVVSSEGDGGPGYVGDVPWHGLAVLQSQTPMATSSLTSWALPALAGFLLGAAWWSQRGARAAEKA